MSWGVGFIGAGPGVAALHLPTLARSTESFRPVHFADAGSGRAQELARRFAATASEGLNAVLFDPAVDILAVCSPPAEHAAHVLAAVDAGKRTIFCEKPLATTAVDAQEVIEACRSTGTVLLVGTNHVHDAAWQRAKHALISEGEEVRSINVSVAMPPNSRYHQLVTEPGPAGSVPRREGPNLSNPKVAAAVVRELILGLAIHDLPSIRDIAPRIEGVDFVRAVPPIGYVLGFRAGGVRVVMSAAMLPEGPDAHWAMGITSSRARVDVEFEPAFVHSGSARVSVRTADDQTRIFPRDADDGYIREWNDLGVLARRERPVEYDEILDDALFAITLADAAAEQMLTGAHHG